MTLPGLTSLLRRAAIIARKDPATKFNGLVRSWGEVLSRVERLAGGLQALGIGAGDRVAVLSLNSDLYFETYYAVWWAGAVIVPLNTRWTAAENSHAINEAAPKILMISRHFLPLLDSIRSQTGISCIILMDAMQSLDGLERYEALASHQPVPDSYRQGNDLAGILYTGGTTGHPKGVMLSHGALWANTIGTNVITPDLDRDVRLHVAPMFHIGDSSTILNGTMRPSLHVFLERFVPDEVLETIAEEQITNLFLVPTMVNLLLQSPQAGASDLSCIRRVIYGASPMPLPVLLRAMKAWPNAEFYQAFGQTELSPIATLLEPKDHIIEGLKAHRLTSAGLPPPHVEIKIIAEDGTTLGCNETGEIAVRGPNIMLGYWQQSEATKATIVDGWVKTGDGGYLDEDGYLYVVDRIKDMIISGGENVYPSEIESIIMQHPSVSECAVIGIPCEKWGEAVHAIIVPRRGTTPSSDEILQHCKERLSGYKCPRQVEFRAEPLPLTAANKVLKRDLRKPYWDGRKKTIN